MRAGWPAYTRVGPTLPPAAGTARPRGSLKSLGGWFAGRLGRSELSGSLTIWSRLALVALVGSALGFAVLVGGVIRQPVPEFIGAALVSLLLASLVARRRGRMPLLAALWCAALMARNGPAGLYLLAHPEPLAEVVVAGAMFGLTLTGVIAGVGAACRPAPPGERRAPGWLVAALGGIGGLCLGAVIVAAMARTGPAVAVNPTALAPLPPLASVNFQFDQRTINARAGQTIALRLENHDVAPHSFDIDEFDVHVPMTAGKSGLALFTPTRPGAYRYYCGVPGHGMMTGTIVVAP